MSLHFALSHAGGDFVTVRARRWPFRIGRDARNDLCLPNSSRVSRRHARVVQQDGEHFLVVTGRNPTLLNGEEVPRDKPQRLAHGDVIEFPDYRLEVFDSAHRERQSNDTVHIEADTIDHRRLIRRIAVVIGIRPWTIKAIHQWLQAERNRFVLVRQRHYQLYLGGHLTPETLEQRLKMFHELQTPHGDEPVEVHLPQTHWRAG